MNYKKTHIGSYGIIINNDQIVLIKKAKGGYKGKLDLPGGGIEHKETPTETLKRELFEEAGVEIMGYSLLDVASTNIKCQLPNNNWEDLHHIGIIYTVKIKNQKLKSTPDGLDSLGAMWYNINELNRKKLSPFTIFSLEKLGYQLKNE